MSSVNTNNLEQDKSKEEEVTEFAPDKCSILVIEPDNTLRNQIVQNLKEIGFTYVSETESHDTGLRRVEGKGFNYVLFSTISNNILYHDFLRTVVANNKDTITLPMARNPSPDQVYEAIMLGARGFVVVPCQKTALAQLFELSAREELALATELQDLDRNKVLVSLMSSGLDDLANALKKSRKKKTKELDILDEHFKSSVKMARSFCQGGEQELLKVIEDHMIKQSLKIPSHLGNLRKKIAQKRMAAKAGKDEKDSK